jgi:RNA polymerase sigma-70 factor (ECF subfamily)
LELQHEETLWRERASKGDSLALGQIYDAYAQRIYRYLYRRVGDVAVAEDLAADVFLRMVESSGSARFCQGSLAPWLYRLAHNRLVDYFRRHKEVPLPDEDNEPVSDAPVLGLDLGELRAALRSLTPDQQQVISLKFVEGWSNAQVAAGLGKPEGAVKSIQHRALHSLRRLLEAKSS